MEDVSEEKASGLKKYLKINTKESVIPSDEALQIATTVQQVRSMKDNQYSFMSCENQEEQENCKK